MIWVLHDLPLYCGLLIRNACRFGEICYSEAAAVQTIVSSSIRWNDLENHVRALRGLNEMIDLLKHHMSPTDWAL